MKRYFDSSLIKSFLSYISVGSICVATHFCILIFFVEKLNLNPTLSSGMGFIIATSLNYLLQRRWTFRSQMAHHRAFTRYFMVTTLTMCLNILMFWTFTEALDIYYIYSQAVVTILIAILNFAINRHFTFKEEFEVSTFRDNYDFDCNLGTPFYQQALILVGASLVARLVFLTITSAMGGEATAYAEQAGWIAKGNIGLNCANLFCYWEALFRLIGLAPLTAAITASFIPGALLVIPVALIAKILYSERIAWIAGFFTALHPRLIEYSCNGHLETFYLLFFSSGIALWTLSIVTPKNWRYLLGAGLCFGIYMGVRAEALFPFIGCVLIELILAYRRASKQTWTQAFKHISIASYGFLSVVVLCSMITIYGEKIIPYEDSSSMIRFHRFTHALPRTLLSPIFLFAFCLPLFSSRKHLNSGAEFPLLVMLFFPILFFPLLDLTPKHLFAILIPIHIFGAAGITTLTTYIGKEVLHRKNSQTRYFVTPILLLFFIVTIAIGNQI